MTKYKILNFSIILLVFLTTTLIACPPIDSQTLSSRETILQLLKDYSPSGYYLVTRADALPEKMERYWGAKKIQVPIEKPDWLQWVDGDTEKDILNSIGTVVHEMCHQYSYHIAYQLLKGKKIKAALEDNYQAYYIGDNNDILVKETKVFNSNEIAATIPESLRTFRFSNYIGDKSSNASQTSGVYGLLNEFNAYYYDTKAAVDMYPYFRNKMAPEVDRWILFFKTVDSVDFAYQEFRFFIIKYLQYAKNNYPAQYRDIIKNKEFTKAFFTIDSNFRQLMDCYFKIKEEIFEGLRKEGYTVTEDEDNYNINGPQMNYQLCHFMKTYNLLQTELANQDYEDVLKELRP